MKFNFAAARDEYVRSCETAFKVGGIAGAIMLLAYSRYPVVLMVFAPVLGVAVILAVLVPALYAGLRRAP